MQPITSPYLSIARSQGVTSPLKPVVNAGTPDFYNVVFIYNVSLPTAISIIIPERSEGMLFHQTLRFSPNVNNDRNSTSKKAKRVIAIEICLWGVV